MTIFHLIFRELLYRRLNVAIGLLSIAAAVACLIAQVGLLRQHDIRTEQIITDKTAETQQRMEQLTDDYRKIMLKMGFNVLILPKDQNLSDLYADDYAAKYMPEEYATRLAKSRVATINHILPSLQQKIRWPEYERTIILMGVRGEVYVQNKKQKPLLEPVALGTMVVGYELARNLKLAPGDQAKLMSRPFTVAKINPERGNKDDITVWINLPEAQDLLDKKGLINGILALDCTCDTVDRLGLIRAEIARVLPDTQIIEYASQALTRAETRQRAETESVTAIAQEKAGRAKLRSEREAFASVLVPIVMLGSAIWIGFLALANVRERRNEIGILRALGLSSRQILLIFLGKAGVIGLIGSMIGYVAGSLIGPAWHKVLATPSLLLAAVDLRLLLAVLITAPLLAILASWLPAILAAQQDPADVLREE